MPAHTTTLVHADAWIVIFDSLFHCRPRRRVDSNHRPVIRCACAHHHPRPRRCVDSNFRLVVPLSFPTVRRQYPSTRYSVPAHTILVHASAGIVIRLVMPLSSTPAHRQYPSTRRDVYVCYSVLTDAAVSHIEVHTATTRYRAPLSERCRSNGYASACNARCNYTSAEAYSWCAGAHEPFVQAGAWIVPTVFLI